jgi:RNA polymerase sigma-70 factor (ECF subfamily)
MMMLNFMAGENSNQISEPCSMNKTPEPDESALLARLRAGDPDALKVLFDRHFGMAVLAAYRLVQDEGIAKDLAQEVFFRLWKNRESLIIQTSVGAYLRRAAVNHAINHVKSRRMQFERAEEQIGLASGTPGVDQHLAADDLQTAVNQAIDSLPPQCRVVFSMSRFEEMPHKEIAEALGISSKTIENQITKALKILRKKLAPYLSQKF